MVQYFSKEFFDELANALNADPEWVKKAAPLTFKTVITITDRGKSYLLDVVAGRVAASETAPDVPADFKFDGPYDSWVILGKGEKDWTMGGPAEAMEEPREKRFGRPLRRDKRLNEEGTLRAAVRG